MSNSFGQTLQIDSRTEIDSQLGDAKSFIITHFQFINSKMRRLDFRIPGHLIFVFKTCYRSGILRTGSFEVHSKMKGGGLSQ